MPQTLRAVQAVTGGEISGNGEELITGVNALELAGPGVLTFADYLRMGAQTKRSAASAIFAHL